MERVFPFPVSCSRSQNSLQDFGQPRVFWRGFKKEGLQEPETMGFVTRSLLVLMFLYGVVFVLGDLALLHNQAPIWWGFAFVVALIGIQYLISPWIIEWIYSIGWYEEDI